jgi:hypothetical protein
MRLSNFKLIKTSGNKIFEKKYLAEVDLTTTSGAWFWKKENTVRRTIGKEFIGFWFFTDTGEYTPSLQAEELARAWRFTTGEDC